jgi:hypothetical protein
MVVHQALGASGSEQTTIRRIVMLFLVNSFSLNMLNEELLEMGGLLEVSPLKGDDLKWVFSQFLVRPMINAISDEDTDNLVRDQILEQGGVLVSKSKRVTVSIGQNDTVILAQWVPGERIKWFWVDFESWDTPKSFNK